MHRERPLNAVLAKLHLRQGAHIPQGAGGRGGRPAGRAPPPRAGRGPAKAQRAGASYSVIIGGVWILVTGDDLRSHPVGGAYERISPPNSPVELSAHPEIDWGEEKGKVKHNEQTSKRQDQGKDAVSSG